MQLISLKNISLNFGTQTVLNGVNFEIVKGQRICLIGRNGTGKSSLLKIIENKIAPDSGEVVIHNNAVVSSMTQEMPEGVSGNVTNVILSSLGVTGEKLAKYLTLICTDPESEELGDLQEYIDTNHAWDYINDVDVLASKLILDPNAMFSDLSGGMKRRVILARALIKKPDLLLLDEPTNHLDIESIQWLENFLINYRGAILFITHDRKFLNRVAKSIVELDRGNLFDFDGNYAKFLEKKDSILENEEKENALFDKKLALEEVWIRQGVKARRTRNEGRVRSLEKMRQDRSERTNRIGKVDINVTTVEKSSRKVIQANNIGFHYDGDNLFENFSLDVQKGDKIAIIGKNGCGKSTLLNCLLNKVDPTSGDMIFADNMKVAYFDQLRDQLDEKLTVIDNVKEGSDFITIAGKEIHVITYLQKFLFSPERLRSPITHLSGGEKNRLLMAKILSKPSNIIVLDEPTNDLDIETLEILEDMLMSYQGTILMVSHDREFINNIATNSIVFEDGTINEYLGGYDDWLVQKEAKANATNSAKPKNTKNVVKEKLKSNLSQDQRKQLRNLPEQIEKLEENITALDKLIADPELYKKPQNIVKKHQQDLKSLNDELAVKFELWENLLTM